MENKNYTGRSLGNFDLKNIKVETRADEQTGKKFIQGIIPYNSASEDLGGFVEYIKPSAFLKSISDRADVKALYNHDSSSILGRIKNNTLTLTSTDTGMLCEVEIGNQSYAQDLFESVSRGDVTTMSFGFQTIKDSWNYESTPAVRYLEEVKLLEVSFGVVFPAYESTNSIVDLRSIALEELIKEVEARKVTEEIKPEEVNKDIYFARLSMLKNL